MKFNTIQEKVKEDIDIEIVKPLIEFQFLDTEPAHTDENASLVCLKSIAKSLIIIRNELKAIRMKS